MVCTWIKLCLDCNFAPFLLSLYLYKDYSSFFTFFLMFRVNSGITSPNRPLDIPSNSVASNSFL